MNRARSRFPMPSTLRILTMLTLAMFASGCRAPSAYFQPAEKVITETVDRVPGALYELRDDSGQFGEVRVWCLRAEQHDQGEDQQRITYVDLGVEIENRSRHELVFAPKDARLRSIQTNARMIDSAAPFDPPPTVRVAPDSVTTTYLSFELPADVRPRDIRSFRLRWEVLGQAERRFTEFTAFIRFRPQRHRSHWPIFGFAFGYSLFHGHWH